MREMLAARDDRDFVVAGPRAPSARRVVPRPETGIRPEAGIRPETGARSGPNLRREPEFGADADFRLARRPAGGRAGEALAMLGAALGAVRRRFGLIAGLGLATAGGVAVCFNALSLQTGRHPAPIFASAEATRAAPRAVRPVEPVRPLPPAGAQASAPPSPAPGPPAPAAQTGSIAQLPPARRAAETAKAPARDAIGEMIRATDPAAPAVRADRSVAFAQRALGKLGYGALKPDGVMGPGTKAALEKYERDQKLPVTGEAAGRTLRDLASRSGLAQD